MKRKMTFSLTLTLTLLLSLVSLPLTGQGQQPPGRFSGDTGVVFPVMGQILRVTVAKIDGNDRARVRFAWTKYMAAGCNNDGVCGHNAVAHGITSPAVLPDDSALSFDVQGTGAGVRVMIRVDTSNVEATAQTINTLTGEVISQVIMANTEGD